MGKEERIMGVGGDTIQESQGWSPKASFALRPLYELCEVRYSLWTGVLS